MNKNPETVTEWIRAVKPTDETMPAFLKRLVKEKTLATAFTDFIIQHPRQNKIGCRLMMRQLSKRQWQSWYQAYTQNYANFIHQKWNQAKRIEDVLKIIPNFSPWALRDRFHHIDIGHLPANFGTISQYHMFLNKLYNSKTMREYRLFKSIECNLEKLKHQYPEIKKIDWFDMTKREAALSKILHKIVGHTFTIQHNKHRYNIQYLCNPFSSKMVFRIQSDTKETYILKMSAHQYDCSSSDAARKEAENQAIRADSPFSNAMMEFYLKLNHCPHAPDILHYTETYDAVLYKEQKGSKLAFKTNPDFLTINNKYLKDANRLGIYINDIALHNFLQTKTGIIKIIDIGHASFVNPLTPGIPGLTFTFGNLCGQDYLTHFGVFSLED